MKFKTNISALLLALLVLISSNGIALSEHFCNTKKSHNFSVFTKVVCEIENQSSSCCSKKIINKKNCCEHKQFFKKLSFDGFTAKSLGLKKIKKIVLNNFEFNAPFFYHKINLESYISGIPPPDNLYTIKYLLRPTTVALQVFRC